MKRFLPPKLAIVVFTIFIVLFGQGFGQKKLDFGLMVGPEFNPWYYTKKISSDVSGTPKLGFVVDGHLQWNLSAKLSIDFGVGYGLKRFRLMQNDLTFSSDMNPDGTFEKSTSETTVSSHTFQAPILLKYYFGESEMRFFAGLGINSMFQFRQKGNTLITRPDGATETYEWQNRVRLYDLSPQASFGFTKPLDERHVLNVELYTNVYPLTYSRRSIWAITTGLRLGIWL